MLRCRINRRNGSSVTSRAAVMPRRSVMLYIWVALAVIATLATLVPVALAGNPTASGVSATLEANRIVVTGTAGDDNIRVYGQTVAAGTYFGGLPETTCLDDSGDPDAEPPVPATSHNVAAIDPVPAEDIIIIQISDETVPENVFDAAAIVAGWGGTLPDGSFNTTEDSCDYANRDGAANLQAYISTNLPSNANVEIVEINFLAGDDIFDGSTYTPGEGGDILSFELYAGAGNDTMVGGPGNDIIDLEAPGTNCDLPSSPNYPYCESADGDLGNDLIYGSSGNDLLIGGPNAVPEGEDGTDNDTIEAGAGDDSLFGGLGDDTLRGEEGNDQLVGGPGNDIISGGDGEGDVLDYYTSGEGVTVDLPNHTATGAAIGTDSIDAGSPSVSVEVVRGSNSGDTITGHPDKAMTLLGMGDNDTITGGGKPDIIFGGTGDDNLAGGGDFDQMFGNAGGDTVAGEGGDDYVFGDGDDAPLFMIGEDISESNANPRTYMGLITSAVGAPVDAGGNLPVATSASPFIYLPTVDGVEPTQTDLTVSGDDTVLGGPGLDLVVGGPGADLAMGGIDLPDSTTLTGMAGFEGGSDDASDIIFGDLHIPYGRAPQASGDAGDKIRGGGGADYIVGGGGSDYINGDAGDDVIHGDFDYDYDKQTAGSRFRDDGILEIRLQMLLVSGTPQDGDDTLYGGLGSDLIEGGGGGDYLFGGANIGEYDIDVLRPGPGVDRIYGGEPSLQTDSESGLFGFPISITQRNIYDAGYDTLDYSLAGYSGVEVDLGLSFNAPSGGAAAVDGDSLAPGLDGLYGTADDVIGYDSLIQGIENLVGSDFDDVLFGTNDIFNSETQIWTNSTAYLRSTILRDSTLEIPGDVEPLGEGFSSLYVSGGAYANIIIGRSGNDRIMARDGQDLVFGGLGDDLICGDEDVRCECPEEVELLGECTPTLLPSASLSGSDDYLVGSHGADTILANGGDDIVFGGAGGDFLSGGVGEADVLSYQDADAGVAVNLRATISDVSALGVLAREIDLPWDPDPRDSLDPTQPDPLATDALTPLPVGPCAPEFYELCGNTVADAGYTSVGYGQPRAIDVIYNGQAWVQDSALDRFEVIEGTDYNDVLYGHDSRPVQLVGYDGDDILIGGEEADTNSEKAGRCQAPETCVEVYDNVLWGDTPNATVGTRADGDDVLISSSGDDFLDGGPKPIDTATTTHVGDFVIYWAYVPTMVGSTEGVTVSLADSTPQNTGHGWDTLRGNVRNLAGSLFDDTLRGSMHDDLLLGLAGDDTFDGSAGEDIFNGGAGTDAADYQSCNCIDPDKFVSDLAAGVVPNDGWDSTDFLISIESVLAPADPIVPGSGGGAAIPAPLEATAGDDAIITAGGSAELQGSATGGVAPYTILWDVFSVTEEPPSDLDPVIVDEDTLTPTVSPLVTTVFRITVTDAVGSTATDFATVQVVTELTVDCGVGTSIAAGNSIELAAIAGGGELPFTFLWTADSDEPGFFDGVTKQRITVTPGETTTYTCTVTDALGSEASDTITITVVTSVLSGGSATPGNQPVVNPPVTTPDDNSDQDSGNDDEAGDDDEQADGDPPRQSSGDGVTPIAPSCGFGMNASLVAANLLGLCLLRRRRWNA